MTKTYITPDDLLTYSYQLGGLVWTSGYRPNILIGVARGGMSVAIAVHEMLRHCGLETEYNSIRTRLYTDQRPLDSVVMVDGLEGLVRATDRVLIVDDVCDTGKTIHSILATIPAIQDVRVATVFYKPDNAISKYEPEYYLFEGNNWIVFPHEVVGLTKEEIVKYKSAEQVELLNVP